MSIRCEPWGEAGGQPVDLYTLTRDTGMRVSVATYGGVVTRLEVPDRDGVSANVTLGYDSLEQYLSDTGYFGCIIGRVANRVGSGRFWLDGSEYELDRNHGSHHLHGGSRGFHTRVWDGEAHETPDGPRLTLTRTSPDGEQGYPGTLTARVDVTLTADGVRFDCAAASDKATPVAMTNHSYFNLSGELDAGCQGHHLTVPAGRILAADEAQIPTGDFMDVTGTRFDFRDGRALGEGAASQRSASDGGGYDQYFVLDDASDGLKLAATLTEPESGRSMEVWTTSPGIQLYSGDHIPAGLQGSDGVTYGPGSGLCLEAHEYVDAPNHPGFPSVVVRPGESVNQTIIYKFMAK